MKNTPTVIVAGAGSVTASILNEVEKARGQVVVIADAFQPPPIIIKAAPQLASMEIGNSFKCEGKHQYREVKGQWICQCGRNMKV